MRCIGHLARRQPLKPEGNQTEMESHGKSFAVCKPKSFFKQNGLPLPSGCSGLFAQRPCPAQGKALTHS